MTVPAAGTAVAMVVKKYFKQLDHRLHRAKLSLRRSGFSTFGEEQILGRLVAELLPPEHNRVVVDIGAGNGIRASNTYALFRDGWDGVCFEYDGHKMSLLAKAYQYFNGVALARCRVTPDNVVPLLRAHGVRKDFSVLNLDIDSYDYWVLDALLSDFRPRLVVTEINEKIPPPIKFVVKYDPDFQLRHHFYGHSIVSLAELCERHGYALIELEYNNAFLAPIETPGVRPMEAGEAYRRGYSERADRREKFRPNHDMEILHALTPEEGVRFIKQFFSRHEGKYEVGVADEAPPDADAAVSLPRDNTPAVPTV